MSADAPPPPAGPPLRGLRLEFLPASGHPVPPAAGRPAEERPQPPTAGPPEPVGSPPEPVGSPPEPTAGPAAGVPAASPPAASPPAAGGSVTRSGEDLDRSRERDEPLSVSLFIEPPLAPAGPPDDEPAAHTEASDGRPVEPAGGDGRPGRRDGLTGPPGATFPSMDRPPAETAVPDSPPQVPPTPTDRGPSEAPVGVLAYEYAPPTPPGPPRGTASTESARPLNAPTPPPSPDSASAGAATTNGGPTGTSATPADAAGHSSTAGHVSTAGTAGPGDGATVPAVPAVPADGPAESDPAAASPATSPADGGGTGSADTSERADAAAAPQAPDTVLPAPAGPVSASATALRAPTMVAPVVPEPAEGGDDSAGSLAEADDEDAKEDIVAPPADPEQTLASYEWRFHADTLRELVDNPDELRAIRDRLTEKITPTTDNRVRARLLSLRAVVSRILGDLGKALADAKLALAHAEATGELRRVAIAQARLAHVLQWRGDFAEADRLFEEANSPELPDRLRATMHEHAGRSCYDQGRYIEACNHFERALDLRKVEDPELIARTELALDAVFKRVAENGWGPYPRSREEVLQLHRPPVPAFDGDVQRWGYHHPDGSVAVAPAFADAQPFHEGVAWVRRPDSRTWELIDETGTVLIDAGAGYVGVGSFGDGLAWVSADGTGRWIAVDKTNRVVIGTGFDDVRPFRRGLAAVRRGGWGAVDRTGRIVVPTRYTAFVTALTDGRYIDGFTDEGLAIVDLGGRRGVVNRDGEVIVQPAYPGLVIHPVAFLIGLGNGRWGALDRRGQPLIDAVHPSRTDVIDEIDRLLADTKPVL